MMHLQDNTILITGGSEGIGFELAKALVADNTVIICGRNRDKLQRAAATLPGVQTETCDITFEKQRQNLVTRLLHHYPDFNVLINNAGGKINTNLLAGRANKEAMIHDMALNFTAPAALCTELLTHLTQQPRPSIVNMSTGLVYLPKAAQAFYCAGKAALHSYTESLRWSLGDTNVAVYEVFHTLVDTHFHQGRLPTNIRAISAEEAARQTLNGLRKDRHRIHIDKAALARWIALLAPQRGMAIVNQ